MSHRLHIVHTNDIHSFFEQMPKIYTVIQTIREAHPPEEVLVLDGGDHMDRMRVETEGTRGLANIDIMNKTGYEFHVLGNNEGLTFPADIIARMYREHAEFEVIASNMFEMNSGKKPDWIQPYKIIQKGSVRVGIIGVTIDFKAFYDLLGWDVRNPYDVTRELVKQIRPHCDLLIVMSHLGLGHDRVMAETIDGIDIIIGGHTHHLLEQPLLVNQTVIAAAGKFGQYVGELVVSFDESTKRIIEVEGRCIDVQPYAANSLILNAIRDYRQQGDRNLEVAITTLVEPFDISWHRESSLGNLLASGIKRWTGAQVALVNAGQIMNSLSPGVVTKGRLLEICPSPINPCKMTLRGIHIKQALEESLLEEFIHKPIRGFGFRGHELGTLCLDGLMVYYETGAAPYHKIKSILIEGMPLDLNAEYTVGTLDMFTFGIGYMSIREGTNIQFYLPEFIRDVLGQQLQNPAAIKGSEFRRWRQNDL